MNPSLKNNSVPMIRLFNFIVHLMSLIRKELNFHHWYRTTIWHLVISMFSRIMARHLNDHGCHGHHQLNGDKYDPCILPNKHGYCHKAPCIRLLYVFPFLFFGDHFPSLQPPVDTNNQIEKQFIYLKRWYFNSPHKHYFKHFSQSG